jgi:multicomponent K+:H+ antiporter subunit F
MIGTAVYIAALMLCGALVLSVIRLARGPDAVDRILALDTAYINAAALVLVYGVHVRSADFFEAALLIALLGFVGTLSLARFLLRGDIIE